MRASPPITIAIARFEDLLARGLRAVIDDDPSLVVLASDVEQQRVSVILRAHHPRVAILDLDAIASLAEVRELNLQYPDTSLVLLAARPTGPISTQLLAFGASACLGRDTQTRDVLSAIHLASRGLQLSPRGVAGGGPVPTAGSQPLTQREADVLPLLQQGRSNAQIAGALQIGVETVRSHARNIYRKFGVSSRRELVAQPQRPAVDTRDTTSAQPPRHWVTPIADRKRRPGSLRR